VDYTLIQVDLWIRFRSFIFQKSQALISKVLIFSWPNNGYMNLTPREYVIWQSVRGMKAISQSRCYKYLGDRMTTPELKGATCHAVEVDGKCIRRGASMLVSFGRARHVVLARLLRKVDKK
jgi:hypothetical protein